MSMQQNILTFLETEQLCRLYLDCRLSVAEETELQYVLGKLPYRSRIIDEARESMGIAVALGRRSDVNVRKTAIWRARYRYAGVAASVVIALAVSVSMWFIAGDNVVSRSSIAQREIVAYEAGKKLAPEAASAAVDKSIRKADMLMARSEAFDKASLEHRNYLMNLTDDTK